MIAIATIAFLMVEAQQFNDHRLLDSHRHVCTTRHSRLTENTVIGSNFLGEFGGDITNTK